MSAGPRLPLLLLMFLNPRVLSRFITFLSAILPDLYQFFPRDITITLCFSRIVETYEYLSFSCVIFYSDWMESLLTPVEELTLTTIKEQWESEKQKLSITDLSKKLKEEKNLNQSVEKTRLIVEALWRKGEILIDVQGRERMVRPNHVTINSKTEPLATRNFTILDEAGYPTQRIWVSVYKSDKGKYFSISESRWNGSWKTTSNIIVPPDALEEFETLVAFLKTNMK